VPLVDSTYYHLWVGNNRDATGGPLADETLKKNAPADKLRDEKSQPRRYAQLGAEVVAEVQRDPAATLQRRVWAWLDFWFGERFLRTGSLADRGDGAMPDWLGSAYPAALLGWLTALFFFGLLGWRWTFGWRRESMPSALALIWVPLPYVLGHAEALHGP